MLDSCAFLLLKRYVCAEATADQRLHVEVHVFPEETKVSYVRRKEIFTVTSIHDLM